MDLDPDAFWSYSPYLFACKLEGFISKESKAALYFREMYALLYNVNRGEKGQILDGKDVLPLYGEKKQQIAKGPRLPKRTKQEWEEILDRISRS